MPDPTGSPSILLLHDGELEDVRALLDALGATPTSLGSAEPATATRTSWDLIVTTARRALSHPDCLSGGDELDPPTRVVFASEDSPTLRRQLRATGFDYLVRRPVDPAALRLLFLRLLYQGPERRRVERFPFGREVAYQLGGQNKQQHAMLGDLSESGCRLLHAVAAKAGQTITVEVPAGEAGNDTFSATGTVLRVVPPGKGEEGNTLAIEFEELSFEELELLREALRTSVVGSAAAPGRVTSRPERRREHRGAFPRRVVALRGEADRVLMGCDLSVGGMRVEPHPTLNVGDRMRLAIYAENGASPWLVAATVARNDKDGGLALRFDTLAPDIAHKLEAFVASLPPVEPLQRGELGSLGAVLTQIVD